MTPTRIILAVASVCLLLAHMTGNVEWMLSGFDLGVDIRDIPYLLALPATALFTLFMLRN